MNRKILLVAALVVGCGGGSFESAPDPVGLVMVSPESGAPSDDSGWTDAVNTGPDSGASGNTQGSPEGSTGGTYEGGAGAAGQAGNGSAGSMGQAGSGGGVTCQPIGQAVACAGQACGEIRDECGVKYNCGPCCTPNTKVCDGKTCGSLDDGCGGQVNCGTCAYSNCGADNNCVCTRHPEYDARCVSWGTNESLIGFQCTGDYPTHTNGGCVKYMNQTTPGNQVWCCVN